VEARDDVTALLLVGRHPDRWTPGAAVHAAAHRCVALARHRAAPRGRFKASALLTDSPARVRWIEDTELRSIDPDL
jgi:hypothetical protein